MESIWTKGIEMPHFPALAGDEKTDVLIIGGGMAGILCAYFLRERGVDYILVEGRTVGSGVTANTTAKITSQHGLIYHRLLQHAGAEMASMYLAANQDAVKKYAELCRQIPCDFQWKPSCVYSVGNRKKLEQEAEALSKIGFPAEFLETTELPFPVAGAIAFADQAQFHPLKFLAGISENLKIREHTFVKALKDHTAVTDRGNIVFQKVIFATHFPIDNKHGMYFLKLYQHRSYVLALEHGAALSGMYVDENPLGMSFRNYGELLLVGGGAHRTGERGGDWQEIRNFTQKYYPHGREMGCWSTQDCMSLDQVPYIGPYSKSRPHCFVAAGFNKWGITSSMAAAGILTSMIMEEENPYSEVFCPSRNMISRQLFVNGGVAVKNMLAFSKKCCPHMGCTLKWNGQEHSWDCPCHGSRFDEKGELLDNPANGNLI